MAVRPIVVWPDPRLREETRPIESINDEVRALYRDLSDSMFGADGIGIAAVQIGVAQKMFLLEARLLGGADTDEPVAFINPEITWLSDEVEEAEEGCLSFPGIYVPIARSLRCRVKAMGIDGQITEREVEGLAARAVQHEYDHLTGKLMVDFVGPLKKQMIKRKLKRQQEESETSAVKSTAGKS
jgi:peptide deformylase